MSSRGRVSTASFKAPPGAKQMIRGGARYISAAALAERWSSSLPAIYRMVERAEIASLRVGERSVRILLSSVEKYEQEHTVGSA